MKDVANRTKNDAFWLIVMRQNFLNINDVIVEHVKVTTNKLLANGNNETTIETKIYVKECSLIFSLQSKL